MAQQTSGGTRRRWWIIIGTAAVILLVGAYLLIAAWQSTKAPAGAQAVGVDIGGMSREDAVAALTDGLDGVTDEDIEVVAGESSAQLTPADVGLDVDIDATVDRALGFSLDPRVMWERFAGETTIEPAFAIDEDALGPVLAETAADLTTEPVDALLEYDEDGAAIVTKGTDGTVVTDTALREALEAQWLRTDAVSVDPTPTEPDITTAEAEQVRTEVAEPAVSDDVELEATDPDGEDHALTVSADMIAAQLTFEPSQGTLAPVFDAEALTDAVFEANPDVGVAPKDASFDISGDTLTVVPAETGLSADADDLAAAVTRAMTADPRSDAVDLTEVEPDFTTEDAEEADFSDTVSEFSTPYSSSPNRDTNLRVSTDSVRGTVLLPGEQFSLNEALGQRTAANGYKPAGVISEGQMKEDYGGGVSQVSTTLFNAAFFAGFDLDEHRAHSRYISRYPEGRETTLDWTSIDLKFTNTADTPVVLDMSLSGGEVHARVLGVKTVEVEAGASDRFAFTSPGTVRESGPSCTPQSPGEGWSITIYRTIRDAGSGDVVQEDDFTTVYRPVNRVICED